MLPRSLWPPAPKQKATYSYRYGLLRIRSLFLTLSKVNGKFRLTNGERLPSRKSKINIDKKNLTLYKHQWTRSVQCIFTKSPADLRPVVSQTPIEFPLRSIYIKGWIKNLYCAALKQVQLSWGRSYILNFVVLRSVPWTLAARNCPISAVDVLKFLIRLGNRYSGLPVTICCY